MEFDLKLTEQEAQFLLNVLAHQPLPYAQTAPLINKIAQQAAALKKPPEPEAGLK